MKAVFKDINLKLGAERKKNKKSGKRSSSSNDYDCTKGNQCLSRIFKLDLESTL